jgi:hypothetical protein
MIPICPTGHFAHMECIHDKFMECKNVSTKKRKAAINLKTCWDCKQSLFKYIKDIAIDIALCINKPANQCPKCIVCVNKYLSTPYIAFQNAKIVGIENAIDTVYFCGRGHFAKFFAKIKGISDIISN